MSVTKNTTRKIEFQQEIPSQSKRTRAYTYHLHNSNQHTLITHFLYANLYFGVSLASPTNTIHSTRHAHTYYYSDNSVDGDLLSLSLAKCSAHFTLLLVG